MDVSGYVAEWRARVERERHAVDEAVARARAALPAARDVLVRRGATRVWLIGSLPRGTFRPGSDLDFLVEGMDDRTAWRAASEASDLIGLRVDVIRAEDLDEGWRRHHARFGETLHG